MKLQVCVVILLLVGLGVEKARAAEPVRLQESFSAGYQYRVTTRVDLSGQLQAPSMDQTRGKPETLTIHGDGAAEYDEKVLPSGSAEGPKTIRVYRRFDMRRKVGDDQQQAALRPAVRRLVMLKLHHMEVPFSPDGPLTTSEIDLLRTDVFTPALVGLLPSGLVQVGDRWNADDKSVTELTDLVSRKEGKLECRLQEISERNGKRMARVNMSGTVAGESEDGPNRQKLEGYFLFDLQANYIAYLYLDGASFLLDSNGQSKGRIDGRFVLSRRVESNLPELSDQALRGVTLAPNDDNTRLLFQDTASGVEFLYPRRWTVRLVNATQIVLNEPRGGGLVITPMSPSRVPTAGQFQSQASAELQKKSAKIRGQTPPERLRLPSGDGDHFTITAEIDREPLVLDHYIVRQAAGGATITGRYPDKEAASLSPSVRQIVESLKLAAPN